MNRTAPVLFGATMANALVLETVAPATEKRWRAGRRARTTPSYQPLGDCRATVPQRAKNGRAGSAQGVQAAAVTELIKCSA